MSDSTISSRTPEGTPNRCPVCGNEVIVEPSQLVGDAPCPHCGQLLWFLRTTEGPSFWRYEEADEIQDRLKARIAEQLGVPFVRVKLDQTFINDLGADSLDTVELIMELEEEFGLDFGIDED
jgi:acyl carrier protein